jgi:hypothetical protein
LRDAPVPHAADRLDEVFQAAGFLDLLAKRLHVNVYGAFEHDRAFADGRVHEVVAAEGAARLPKQAEQQLELRRRQVHNLALDRDSMADAVNLHAAVLDHVAGIGGAIHAAEQGLHLFQEHLVAERLGHVIVRAHFVAHELIRLLGLGGGHDDGDVLGAFSGAEFAADVQPGHAGEHKVEEHGVREDGLRLTEPFGTIVRDERFESLAVEVPRKGLREAAFVFDDEDAWLTHRGALVLGSGSETDAGIAQCRSHVVAPMESSAAGRAVVQVSNLHDLRAPEALSMEPRLCSIVRAPPNLCKLETCTTGDHSAETASGRCRTVSPSTR